MPTTPTGWAELCDLLGVVCTLPVVVILIPAGFTEFPRNTLVPLLPPVLFLVITVTHLCLVGSANVYFCPDLGVGGIGSPFVTVRSLPVLPPRGPSISY